MAERMHPPFNPQHCKCYAELFAKKRLVNESIFDQFKWKMRWMCARACLVATIEKYTYIMHIFYVFSHSEIYIDEYRCNTPIYSPLGSAVITSTCSVRSQTHLTHTHQIISPQLIVLHVIRCNIKKEYILAIVPLHRSTNTKNEVINFALVFNLNFYDAL